MDLPSLIKEQRTDFADLCRSHKVAKLYAFGSSITEHFNPDSSDIDIWFKIDIPDPADRGDALLLI